jgi:Pyridoxamine 5'-phosphate oxidase
MLPGAEPVVRVEYARSSVRHMSIPVALHEIPDVIAEYGPAAYLLSVGADGRPRALSVVVTLADQLLAVSIGSRTAANIAQQPHVSLLWPTPQPGGLAIIIDGTAIDQTDGSDGRVMIQIEPTNGVRHQTVTT